MLSCAERFRWWVLVAEASYLLIVARALIAFAPLRWWRASLGRVAQNAPEAGGDQARPNHIARAVNRAAARLPLTMVCLPRAMVVQWMLGRRGLHSVLVFGILPEADRSGQGGAFDPLHAWVEAGGHIIIGEDGSGGDGNAAYRRGLMLVQ
jgi:hypothetical protein